MTKGPDDLFAYLDSLGITVSTRNHEPLFTVNDSQALRGNIPGAHTKNLFLKDKKSNHFLVTLDEAAVVDLKKLHTLIGGSGRLSFGNAEAMMDMLGVNPGSVSVFGLINDEQRRLQVVLDEALMRSEVINGHPLRNTATTSISKADLLKFIRATGHEPTILKVTA